MMRLHETAMIVPLGAVAPAEFRRNPRLSAGPRGGGPSPSVETKRRLTSMKKYFVILALALGFFGAAAQAASTLDIKEAWYGVKGSSECHRFKSRLLLCNDDASCKFSCDSTSACGDPAPGKEKVCNIVYSCSDKPDARVEKSFPDSKTPQELSCE